MNKQIRIYCLLVTMHAFIALLVFLMPFFSKVYALVIPLFGLYFVFSNRNNNHQVLLVAAYLTGVEVFLRMTGGNFNNEYVKILVSIFMIIGIYFSGFSIKSIIYWLFLLLLLPGVLLTTFSDDYSIDIRKDLVFNLSGPICLAFCAIYCSQKKISFVFLQKIVLCLGLPIISTAVFLFLYTPSVRDVVTGTASNFETSGGFGPNQVSTILGLGMFVFFTQFLLFSKAKILLALNFFVFVVLSFRGIVTFSRGGVITATFMILFLLLLLFTRTSSQNKPKFIMVFVGAILVGFGVWTYSSVQTSGLINKRYANQDARGRVKSDRLGGREKIIGTELEMFLDNPILGVGAGQGKKIREKETNITAASHNEIGRLLSEHGLFGLLGFAILLFSPLASYFSNKQHFYLVPFFVFWLLTINHAAMRLAAPAFVYALSLVVIVPNVIKVNKNNTPSMV